jgi:hypothetical protein
MLYLVSKKFKGFGAVKFDLGIEQWTYCFQDLEYSSL